MKKILSLLAVAALLFGAALSQSAKAKHASDTPHAHVGEAAPDFEGTTITGESFKLSDHKGDIVVLEWTNHKCPFVVKHYGSNNMQNLQKMAAEKGVKWVSIVSSAPGKQGHLSAEEAQAVLAETGATPTIKLLDESGQIGKLYDAKTTPHIFVVDASGILAYAGAIDSDSSANPTKIEGAKNYVEAAINDLTSGGNVKIASTSPYGCSVKY